MRTVITRGIAALLLLAVLATFPVIAALPHQIGAIRLAGLSLLWWYGGVIAPMLAGVMAVAWLSGPPPPSRPE
jgi:uncharacterized membrane protein